MRIRPVAKLVTFTDASGIAAPVASVTVPWNVPFTVCANATPGIPRPTMITHTNRIPTATPLFDNICPSFSVVTLREPVTEPLLGTMQPETLMHRMRSSQSFSVSFLFQTNHSTFLLCVPAVFESPPLAHGWGGTDRAKTDAP